MSKSILQFVAGRREAAANAKTPVTNDQQGVSRAEFAQLAALVNTMAQAIEGLIEDFDTVNSPEKLKATVNAAFKGITPPAGGRQPLALKPIGADRGFLAPAEDAVEMQVNNGSKGRPPLALPADAGFSAPAGD